MADQTSLNEETGTGKEIPVEEYSKYITPEKPVFEKNTNATIIDAVVMSTGEMSKDKRGELKERIYMTVSMELDEQLEDGTKDVRTSYSMSLYTQKSGQKTVYWGKESQAAEFRRLVCKTFDLDDNVDLKEVIETMQGKKVIIKSVDVQNPREKKMVKKALIQSFRV